MPTTPTPEHYVAALEEAGIDEESLTVLVAQGATRAEVAAALGVDLESEETDDVDWDDEDVSAYAIGEVPGGVVAVEHTGYADPTLDALRRLSSGGRSTAVVRSNIQAHDRFGCARDGEVVFDDDEHTYVEDRERVPQELWALHGRVWRDPSADADVEGGADVFATGLAMAEVITGLRLTGEDLVRVTSSGYRTAPSLTYSPE